MTRRGRALVALVTIAAFWPVWTWYAARLVDGSDEKWGLLAIGAAAVSALLAANRRTSPPADPPLVPLAALVAVYLVLALLRWPALVRATPALVAIALLLSAAAFGRRLHPGTAALLLLGLPLEATLQFYAGYPMRVAATGLASGLLRLVGLDVGTGGVLLLWNGESVGVDAPCSGIHMLWVGLFLAAGMAALRDFRSWATVLAGLLAAIVVILANGLRVAVLFLKEMRLVPLPSWTHEAIGALIFAGAAVTILAIVGWLERWQPASLSVPRRGPGRLDGGRGSGHPEGDTRFSRRRVHTIAYSLACLLAALATLLPVSGQADSRATAFPGWPATLDDSPLVPVAPRPEDERFARGFPGRFARFTDGRRAVLLRWLPHPSRQLHPAADCLRGAGYRISPRPSRVDARGTRWGCVEAVRQGAPLVVCERIFDDQGRSWTDASSWWWAAALGRSAGPYWAITIVESSS